MSQKTKKFRWNIVVVAIAVLVLGFGVTQASNIFDFTVGVVLTADDSIKELVRGGDEALGGRIHFTQESFTAGIRAGSSDTEVINSSGQIVGAVNSSTGAFSGAITGATTLTITGESNLSKTITGGTLVALFGNATTSAANWCDNSIVRWRGNGTTTIGIASSSDIIADCLPTIGDSMDILFHNYATSSSADITIKTTDGAGNTMVMLETGTDGVVQIQDKNYALMRFTNLTGATTTVTIIDLRDAD